MERINQLFDPTLRKLGISTKVREAQIHTVFAEVVGTAIAPYCRVASLNRGILNIATEHTALSHQLRIESEQLIASLNGRLGSVVVRSIRFTTLDSIHPGRGNT